MVEGRRLIYKFKPGDLVRCGWFGCHLPAMGIFLRHEGSPVHSYVFVDGMASLFLTSELEKVRGHED